MAKGVKKPDQTALIARIAGALERLAPQPLGETLPAGDAFVWEPAQGGLVAVPHVAHVDLSLLKGIDNQRDTLLANTERFAQGLHQSKSLAAPGRALDRKERHG